MNVRVCCLFAVLLGLMATGAGSEGSKPRTEQKPPGILTRKDSQTLRDGLVLHYSFEGKKKHAEDDMSPRHNQAKVNGEPKTVEGKVGKAMEFDGTNDYLEVEPFKLGGAVSVAAWVRFTHFNSCSRVIDLGEGPGAHNILLCNLGRSSALQWQVFSGSGTRLDGLTIPDFWPLDQWVHVVATVDEDGTMSLYRNGVLMQSVRGSVPEVRTRKSQFVGKSNWGNDGLFQGVLDELMIWNRSLSKSEVKALYDGVKTK